MAQPGYTIVTAGFGWMASSSLTATRAPCVLTHAMHYASSVFEGESAPMTASSSRARAQRALA